MYAVSQYQHRRLLIRWPLILLGMLLVALMQLPHQYAAR